MFSTAPTNYDLQFRMLGIPIRVSAWFWLLAAFLGFKWLRVGMDYFLIWMAIVFVSVLVHEFGHALFAKAWGYPPRILLYHFGGLAMFEPDQRYSRSKAIILTLAGPVFGYLLAATAFGLGIVLVLAATAIPEQLYERLQFATSILIFVNIFWSTFNLLPILPLDGGHVMKEICTYFSRYNGLRYAAQVGAVLSGVICAWCVMNQFIVNAFLAGSLCAQNISIAQSRHW